MRKSRITIRAELQMIDSLKECAKKHHSSLSYICNEAIRYYLSGDHESKIFERDKKFKKNLLYEINRYGNNLNQIAYNLNRLLKTDIASLRVNEIDEALIKLSEIENELSNIKNIVKERL